MARKALAILLVVGMMGCGSTGTSGKAAGPNSKTVAKNIPESSKFAKINVGISESRATAILGKPDKTTTHPTGKQHIPFYYGHDYFHTTYYYHGEGRLEIDSDNNVDEVQYDPAETAGLESKPVAQAIPENSKFSKIKVGMSRNHVVNFIGEPDKTAKHGTGRVFNPFSPVSDRIHTTNYYHGEGRIEIDSDNNVDEIQYDPSETAGL